MHFYFTNIYPADECKETPAAATSSSLDSANPSSKAELDQFASAIANKVHGLKLKNALLVPFLDTLVKQLADPLDFSDIRKLSSTLSTLSNEKQRAEKDKKAGGKKKKAQVRVSSNELDEAATYTDNYAGEYDDFM